MSAASMIIRSLTPEGDWNWGQSLNSFNAGQAAIAEDVQTRLMFFQQDYFCSLLFGVAWWQLLSSKNPAAQNGILLQTRQIIMGTVAGYASFGVTGINSVNVYEDARTRDLSLEYDISTIYTTSFRGSVKIPPN